MSDEAGSSDWAAIVSSSSGVVPAQATAVRAVPRVGLRYRITRSAPLAAISSGATAWSSDSGSCREAAMRVMRATEVARARACRSFRSSAPASRNSAACSANAVTMRSSAGPATWSASKTTTIAPRTSSGARKGAPSARPVSPRRPRRGRRAAASVSTVVLRERKAARKSPAWSSDISPWASPPRVATTRRRRPSSTTATAAW